jgi:hypothetical protein
MVLGRCSVLRIAAMRPVPAFLAHPRTITCFTLLVALLWSTAASAQTPPPLPAGKITVTIEGTPSRAFATKSLNALTSLPTASGARWMEVARKNPKAIMAAIASAERRGWKPTFTTTHTVRGASKPGLRPVAMQEHTSTGNGEMLVWDWDDGNEMTGEATVWIRSFRTGHEVTYNVQFWGDTYEQADISFYEGVSTQTTDAYMYASAPLFTPRNGPQFTRAQYGGYMPPSCDKAGRDAVARCNLRNAGRYMRAGLRGVAADFGVAGVTGVFRGGLAAALRAASAPAVVGGSFAAGVLEEAIWGTDSWECAREGQLAKEECEQRLAECRRTRADCTPW